MLAIWFRLNAAFIVMSIGYVLAPISRLLIRRKWCHRYILFLARAHVQSKNNFDLCVSLFASTLNYTAQAPAQSRVVGHSWFFYMINGAVCVRPLWVLIDYLSLYSYKTVVVPWNCTSKLLKTYCIKQILNFAPIFVDDGLILRSKPIDRCEATHFFYK